ncbi:MAG TPA: CAP domain-containing protein, partial [Candidatus Limnocylindria bacterium]
MPRRALATLFAVAAIAIGSSASAATVTSVERSLESATVESDLVALINAYRTSNGLQAVSPNGALNSAAGWMAGDMAARNYIGHVSSDGRSPTQRMWAFGYPATSMYTG